MPERLQKYLARCGIASRRHAEQWILDGKVEVDGQIVRVLGTKVDPQTQEIRVQGEVLRPSASAYYALHKPPGVVCTASDPAGRPRVVDLVPNEGLRLYPIGRLDADSEGLILLTNDGELAQRVAHPRYEVEKVYRVIVRGEPAARALERLRTGVWLAEGRTQPAKVTIERKTRQQTTLRIVLKEGRNRHLRRVLAKVELPVRRLQRIAVGSIRLGSLKRGEFRPLSPTEVKTLKEGHKRTSAPQGSAPRSERPTGSRPPRPGAGTRKPSAASGERAPRKPAAAGRSAKGAASSRTPSQRVLPAKPGGRKTSDSADRRGARSEVRGKPSGPGRPRPGGPSRSKDGAAGRGRERGGDSPSGRRGGADRSSDRSSDRASGPRQSERRSRSRGPSRSRN